MKTKKTRPKTTKLEVTVRHCESGSIEGRLEGRKFDADWSSHELWLNGQCNPDEGDEPIADILEACQEEIGRLFTLLPDADVSDIPFEATYTDAGVEDLKLVFELTPAAAGKSLAELHADGDLGNDIDFKTDANLFLGNEPLKVGDNVFGFQDHQMIVRIEEPRGDFILTIKFSHQPRSRIEEIAKGCVLADKFTIKDVTSS